MGINAQRKKILLVDDNMTNLSIGKNALSSIYEVYTVPSGEKALLLLQKIIPDIILLDIEMPEMDGYETLCRIKADPGISHIPVIFLTAKADEGSELDGLSMGAVDYITKPFSAPLLLKRIETHLNLQDFTNNLQKMVEEKTKKVVELQNAILNTVAELVECRDGTTGGHIERTGHYLQLLLEALVSSGEYAEEVAGIDQKLLIQSTPLHDVGKISIPDAILQKPAKLSESEFEIMKCHSVYGRDIIHKISRQTSESEFLEQAAILALSHHERWDGKGYPHGLAEKKIPIQGRLMAIADVYDALISQRPYKKAFTHMEAVKIITDGRGTQFDPVLIDLFLKIEGRFEAVGEECRG